MNVCQLTDSEVAVYEGLIDHQDAEDVLRSGSDSPALIGAAVAVTTGDTLAGQIAEAKARLAAAARQEGY